MAHIPTNILMTSALQPIHLNRLLQLCSANLPVGGFAFSQGLEYAVEKQWVYDVPSTRKWITVNLDEAIAVTDLAVLRRLFLCLEKQDLDGFESWNQHLIACRESQELYFSDLAMGKALIRLLQQLDGVSVSAYKDCVLGTDVSFVSAFSLAAYLFGLDLTSTLNGFCWTYIDNQVATATKLVPLGQSQAQNLLFELSNEVVAAIRKANELADEEVGNNLPGMAMASAWHETQYSRLFRS